MELQTTILWQFRAPAKILLVLAAMMSLMSQHASAANDFRNETDRLALMELKRQISNDPHGVLDSWNDSRHHCMWPGITCDARYQRVTALTLNGKNLLGSISPYIGNLSFLKFIQLAGNRFYNEIPQEVGRLFQLRTLNLSRNTLSGKIPVNLSNCSELGVLDVNWNTLNGKFPRELTSLKKIEILYLASNNLTGEIPSSIGNLSSIKRLSLAFNHLEGSLPIEMGMLTSLSFINIAVNNITGIIPSSIYNISTISVFTVAINALYGKLPADLGQTLPNLQECRVDGNQFFGSIPLSVANASKLEVLDLSGNKFEGHVPTNLGDLINLQMLNIEGNSLGSNSTGDLKFIESLTNCSSLDVLAFDKNSFGGEIPKFVANLSFQLTELYVGSNHLVGTIPVGLGSLTNLYSLGMEENSLSGNIPSDFAKFRHLQAITLGGNQLSGQIPSSLCNITSLYLLDLSRNRFEGNIPPCVVNFQHMEALFIWENHLVGIISPQIFGSYFSPRILDLSVNSFGGSLPAEVGKLMNIQRFSAAYNKFSGEIPATIGDCSSLVRLEMQGNFFQGTIPETLASLKGIEYLDLSDNNLTGEIPRDLEKLSFLSNLNLSFNDLEGEVPTRGVFGNASLITLLGNNKLCGGIPELQLSSCIVHEKKKEKHLVAIVMGTLSVVILISVSLTSGYVIYLKRDRRNISSTIPSRVDKILKISYHELHRATAEFSPESLIGSGSFGFVFKGRLDQYGGRLVAVKVLNLQKNGASTSFKAECRALRNIRHRNLVSILTYCSSIDSKGHEFKALVYDFMENGNLDMWLHPKTVETSKSRNLNMLQRLNIAIDVASALHYLHYQCETVIVHCDLKPSNILLDNDLVAHVGDFGLARLLPRTTISSSEYGASSSVGLKGSIGYTAPEYGMGCQASTKGDVYSYGILLLEMFTGRRPTDDIFINGLDLHKYVKMNLSEQVMEIVEKLLLSRETSENRVEADNVVIQVADIDGSLEILSAQKDKFLKCIVSIFRTGLKCSATTPNDRMNMNEVMGELHHIRVGFIGDK